MCDLGSTVAQYTSQTLHHRVTESPFFEKKEYAKAFVDAYMQLDRELIEGMPLFFRV
jgi:protein phosphatase 2C family protein 2/3